MCLYSGVPNQAADSDRRVEWQTHFACGLDGVQIPTHYKIVGRLPTRVLCGENENRSRDCLTIGRGGGGGEEFVFYYYFRRDMDGWLSL